MIGCRCIAARMEGVKDENGGVTVIPDHETRGRQSCHDMTPAFAYLDAI